MKKENLIFIPIAGNAVLEGDLQIPRGAKGVVIFAHGSGSSRFSPRNRFVAEILQKGSLGTLLIDLLTKEEEVVDQVTAAIRFDIPHLTERLMTVTKWLLTQETTKGLPMGYFGASTGAAAALCAAARLTKEIGAVVSRGGRPDLAQQDLARVSAPTLLIVGGHDFAVIEMNTSAYQLLTCEKKMRIVAGATHLFEEPGSLEEVARLALEWFTSHFGPFS